MDMIQVFGQFGAFLAERGEILQERGEQLLFQFAPPARASELEAKLAAGGYGYGELKKELFAALLEYFAPFRQKRAELAKNLDHVQQILREGATRANALADETMAKVRKAVGLR